MKPKRAISTGLSALSPFIDGNTLRPSYDRGRGRGNSQGQRLGGGKSVGFGASEAGFAPSGYAPQNMTVLMSRRLPCQRAGLLPLIGYSEGRMKMVST